jgi:hypothetical protein
LVQQRAYPASEGETSEDSGGRHEMWMAGERTGGGEVDLVSEAEAEAQMEEQIVAEVVGLQVMFYNYEFYVDETGEVRRTIWVR